MSHRLIKADENPPLSPFSKGGLGGFTVEIRDAGPESFSFLSTK